jgi:hypothetical protein
MGVHSGVGRTADGPGPAARGAAKGPLNALESGLWHRDPAKS